MSITEWIKYDLIPSLFESIDSALPEHDFKRYAGGWRSKHYLTGNPHKSRIDKTVISRKAPGIILEQGGEVIGIVDYVMGRDNVDFITAVKTLAQVVGLQLPKSDYNPENYNKYKDQVTLLEDCNSYFIFCLENSTGAEEVRSYLSSRGYSSEDIKNMELGYIPDQAKLITYLLSKKYSQSLIDEVVNLNKGIGSTHSLTIPYRSGGSIKGFKFRTIREATPKYLNSTGLDRMGGFFNLLAIKGDKDVVIVEGELDSLSATVKGVNNVVATGGSSISSDQVKDAKRRGAKSFTLCFDMEPAKEEETAKRLKSAIEVILGEGVNKVYIVTLTDLGGGKTDPDRLIKESGVESFRTAMAQAIPYYNYLLQDIINKYGKIEAEEGRELQPKDINNLLDEVVETAGNIPEPIDKDIFKKLFTSLDAIKDLGITEESLTITVDRLTSNRDKEAQAKGLKKLLSEITNLENKGEVGKALELMDSRSKEIKLEDKATEFKNLLVPITEEGLRERSVNKPESLNSGYTIEGEELLLPAGAISILAAPTSHGKTTFLINIALNIAKAPEAKEAYFFSYEEDSDSILINALNVYLNETLTGNNRTTLKNYFAGKNDRTLPAGKEKFFKELIATKKLNIIYTPYDSDTLIEAIRYLHKNTNIGSVFIDYIQLLHKGDKGKNKYNSRQEEIKQICLDLKDLAVETGLPIILGAQFNREVTSLLKLHPTKIGEAGDIERIASLILGFWNNNFKPLVPPEGGELNEINRKGAAPDTIYVTILKNRGGKVGLEETLDFNGNTGKINNKNNAPSTSNYFN